jgi:ankyrin repeat protein
VTALLAAIEHRSLPLLQLLVRHGAHVNPIAEYGYLSPIREAACQDWLEGVRFLLIHGANVDGTPSDLAMSDEGDKCSPDDLTPLSWAITQESKKMVKLLLQHGADVLSIDGIGSQGALIHALVELSEPETLGYDGPIPEFIDMLLAKVPALERHPGWEDALSIVLIDFMGEQLTTRRRILEKVNSLSPMLRRKTAQKAWDKLLNSYDDEERERLVLESIELLIKLGVYIDSRADDGSTILQRAARGGWVESCSYLIDHGAAVNPDATEFCGTPLQEAIKNNHVSLADNLLGHGADINALPAKHRGVTALQAASINGMFELAVRLLERGADVSAPAAPTEGRTAIDGAAERGRFDMVQLLLNAYGEGTDLEPIRRKAARYAEKEHHFELARWLRGDSAA